jgi:hypothetical protein
MDELRNKDGSSINDNDLRKVERHTHNGADSPKISFKNLSIQKQPKAGGNEYLFNGEPFFDGRATGYPGSAPQLELNPDGTINSGSVSMVNAWVNASQELLIDLIKRQETHSRVFVSNGFANITQNPSSDAYDPLFTYFDR